MATEILTELLGWITIINIAVLLLSTFAVVSMRKTITGIHSRLFGLDEKDLGRAYFQYLAQYKIAILAFNLVPYFALKVMS